MKKYIVKNLTMIKEGFSDYVSDYFDTLEDAQRYLDEQIKIDTTLNIWNVYDIVEVEVREGDFNE